MNDSVLSEQYSGLDSAGLEIRDAADEKSMDSRKRALTTRFLLLGMLGILLISFCISIGGYFYLQVNELDALSQRVQRQLDIAANTVSNKPDLTAKRAYEAMGNMVRNRVVLVEAVKLFDDQGRLVGRAGKHAQLPDTINLSDFSIDQRSAVLAPQLLSSQSWWSIVTGDYQSATLASLVRLQGKRAVVLINVDNSTGFGRQRVAAMLLMVFLLLSTALLFTMLYFTFLRGIRTIDEQEQKMNQQIASLSNLLTINKSMQKSIRTASARAVELNEQFLRRTGADLHDGPAQMIGFSIMRLNQALDKDESNLIGPEFHAIKQALEESLEEIRGISSGLVLPELENMSLEQCMRKVVLLHTSTHKTEVGEFYHDIEHEIPLPIKICAYRFVQEGLNNATRHGQAEKCRLTVSLKDELLQISLKDNGVGFRKSQLNNDGKHLGLVGLKDRIESLGGKLVINSELGVGTSLKLSVNLIGEA